MNARNAHVLQTCSGCCRIKFTIFSGFAPWAFYSLQQIRMRHMASLGGYELKPTKGKNTRHGQQMEELSKNKSQQQGTITGQEEHLEKWKSGSLKVRDSEEDK